MVRPIAAAATKAREQEVETSTSFPVWYLYREIGSNKEDIKLNKGKALSYIISEPFCIPQLLALHRRSLRALFTGLEIKHFLDSYLLVLDMGAGCNPLSQLTLHNPSFYNCFPPRLLGKTWLVKPTEGLEVGKFTPPSLNRSVGTAFLDFLTTASIY